MLSSMKPFLRNQKEKETKRKKLQPLKPKWNEKPKPRVETEQNRRYSEQVKKTS